MARSGQHRLLIHAAGSRWPWAILDAAGRVQSRGMAEPAQADWPTALPVVVLVDAARCTPLMLDLPELPRARLRQALRWAAEEHLAGSAEDEHVVAAGRSENGQLRALVVGQSVMEEWLQRLPAERLELLCPDAGCLPWSAGQVSLGAVDGRVLARWGDWSFGSFEPEQVGELLDAVLPPGLDWVWCGGELPPGLTDRVWKHRADELLQTLASQLGEVSVNLLDGPWATGSAQAAGRQWRWVGALAAALVVLGLGAVLLEVQMLKSRSQDLQLAIEQRFAEAFPGVVAAGRHRELAERELARLRFGQSAGLLDLLHRSAPVLSAQSELILTGLSYRDAQLDLSLRAPDVAALDDLERRLRALGLGASVQSASLDGEGASGRIRIAEAGR